MLVRNANAGPGLRMLDGYGTNRNLIRGMCRIRMLIGLKSWCVWHRWMPVKEIWKLAYWILTFLRSTSGANSYRTQGFLSSNLIMQRVRLLGRSFILNGSMRKKNPKSPLVPTFLNPSSLKASILTSLQSSFLAVAQWAGQEMLLDCICSLQLQKSLQGLRQAATLFMYFSWPTVSLSRTFLHARTLSWGEEIIGCTNQTCICWRRSYSFLSDHVSSRSPSRQKVSMILISFL